MFSSRSPWAILPSLVALSLALLVYPALVAPYASSAFAADPPRSSNGFTDVIQWDNYTLFLHNHRMFVQ